MNVKTFQDPRAVIFKKSYVSHPQIQNSGRLGGRWLFHLIDRYINWLIDSQIHYFFFNDMPSRQSVRKYIFTQHFSIAVQSACFQSNLDFFFFCADIPLAYRLWSAVFFSWLLIAEKSSNFFVLVGLFAELAIWRAAASREWDPWYGK